MKEVRTGAQTGQEPGGRSCCRGHGGCCLLVNLLSYRTQNHQLRDGTTHSRLGSPTSISLIKKVFPQTGPQDNLMDTIPQLRFFSHVICTVSG